MFRLYSKNNSESFFFIEVRDKLITGPNMIMDGVNCRRNQQRSSHHRDSEAADRCSQLLLHDHQ